MKTVQICQHASSGCNYPEGECLGLCMKGKPSMNAHTFPLAQWADQKAGRWILVYVLLIGLFLLASSIAAQEDYSSEFVQADEMLEAHRQDDRAAAVSRDLAMQCGGENSIAVPVPKGVQCYDHRGRKTKLITGLARPDSQGPEHAARIFGVRLQSNFECANSFCGIESAGLVLAGFLKG